MPESESPKSSFTELNELYVQYRVSGDEQTFNQISALFPAAAARIYKGTYRSDDNEVMKDAVLGAVTESVLLGAVKNLAVDPEMGKLSTYLAASIHNKRTDYLRSQHSYVLDNVRSPIDPMRGDDEGANWVEVVRAGKGANHIEQNLEADELWKFIENHPRLSDAMKQVILRNNRDGVTMAELVEETGLPKGSLKTLKRQAYNILRKDEAFLDAYNFLSNESPHTRHR